MVKSGSPAVVDQFGMKFTCPGVLFSTASVITGLYKSCRAREESGIASSGILLFVRCWLAAVLLSRVIEPTICA